MTKLSQLPKPAELSDADWHSTVAIQGFGEARPITLGEIVEWITAEVRKKLKEETDGR